MPLYRLTINGTAREVEAPADMPLLWVLRDLVGLRGTKYGCGVGACRACTVHVGDKAVASCQLNVGDVGSRTITTIEGLGEAGAALEQAWRAEEVPPCGYCQPGQIMAAAALLRSTPKPTDEQIDAGMPNVCRCATYVRIKRAVHRAAGGGR
jgi:isoquinoline 1-oxidoreductase alpha subunit